MRANIFLNGVDYTTPFADLLPPLTEHEFAELREDIRAHGVRVAILVTESGEILDGHNRGRIAVELGLPQVPVEVVKGLAEEEKAATAVATNVLRRHLTTEAKRALIATYLRARPDCSSRSAAAVLGVCDKTVASVRRELEADPSAEFPRSGRLLGQDGRLRPARRRESPGPARRTSVPPAGDESAWAEFKCELDSDVGPPRSDKPRRRGGGTDDTEGSGPISPARTAPRLAPFPRQVTGDEDLGVEGDDPRFEDDEPDTPAELVPLFATLKAAVEDLGGHLAAGELILAAGTADRVGAALAAVRAHLPRPGPPS